MTDDMFDRILSDAKRIVGTSRAMASAAFPSGAMLTCATCGYAKRASSEDCARYLSVGWPTHHGQTMTAGPVGEPRG